MYSLAGIKLAVIGGDTREKIYIPILRKLGAELLVYGNDMLREVPDVTFCEKLEDIKDADAVILPLPGISPKGEIHAPNFAYKIYFSTIVQNLKPGTSVFLGVASPAIKELCSRLNLKLVEIAEDDELAILNAVPTAEGTVKLAIELTPHTIHGSRVVIIGYGRVGKVVARIFKNINANVTVVARSFKQLALAEAFGFDTVNFYDKNKAFKYADIIINTVPALVIDKNDMANLSTSCVIIDLAAKPGGVDFEAAKQFNLTAVLASGLPGKVAPKTAGEIIARVLPKLLVQNLNLQHGGWEG